LSGASAMLSLTSTAMLSLPTLIVPLAPVREKRSVSPSQ
jgi:hypothetical protein